LPFVLSAAVLFTACKKDNKQTSEDYTTEATLQADDQASFSTELDAANNDANLALESETGFNNRVQGLICDATVTADTTTNPKTITIVYNGTNCIGNRTRTGTVKISVASGVRWKNPGAVITVSVQNLKITRARDNKSIVINGTHTLTNVSGGLLYTLPTVGKITHTITSSDMSVTFDDGSKRTWQVARKREFTYSNGVVITVTGTHAEGNATNIAEWGLNRFGNAFACAITQPLVFRQDCNFRVVSGQIQHTGPVITATTTFGLDATGKETGCPGTGNYYLKLTGHLTRDVPIL
jgi:hypothetical protein